MEIRMFQSVNGVYSFSPIQLEKFGEKRNGERSLISKDLRKGRRPGCKFFDALTSRQFAPAGHILFCRRSHEVEYQQSLVEIAVPCKDRFAFEHLTKDAPHAPHIYRGSVAA
jgi:hypothetical protein